MRIFILPLSFSYYQSSIILQMQPTCIRNILAILRIIAITATHANEHFKYNYIL
jgi:hypothetical protein